MGDIYLPAGALEPEAERKLITRISDLLVHHEMRRIRDLVDDPSTLQANVKKANSIAWMFVHRTETYVGGAPTAAPYYKFEVSIPQGQIDDEFIPDINRDILAAVMEAEAGRHPHPERRTWVHVHEIPDGHWGAGGNQLHLGEIIDFVAPGMGASAVQRWNGAKREAAMALVELSRSGETSA